MEQNTKEGPGVVGTRPSEGQIASECNRPSNQNTDQSKSPLTQLRLDLLTRGFVPTPVAGKRAQLDGWQERTNPTVDEVIAWDKDYPYCRNTGIVSAPVLDIDILKTEAVEAIEALVRERFGSRGKVLVRTGQRPKIAIPFKTTTPFRIINRLLDPPSKEKREKLEFRGLDNMTVVHGIHPDTHQPYSWRDQPLWEVPRDELPDITEDEARQFIDDAAKVLAEQFSYAIALKYDENKDQKRAEGGDDEPRPPEDPEKIKTILAMIPSDDYWVWLKVACVLITIEGYSPDDDWEEIFHWWSARCPEKYDLKVATAKWRDLEEHKYPYTIRTLFYFAMQFNPTWKPPPDTAVAVTLDDLRANMEDHKYIYLPTRAPWPAASVNARIPPVPLFDHDGNPVLDEDGQQVKVKASAWLDVHRPVEQMTWAPGEPAVIRHRLVAEGGWFTKAGAACLNLYRPPTIKLGDPTKAQPWVDHAHQVYPNDADRIITWCAHRVQRPGEKVNHALLLGGVAGIGKDTLLEPVKRAVGHWNFIEVSPKQAMGRFNGFVKSVVLRMSEARDLGEFDRFQLYEHMKSYIAVPPDVIRVDEKNLREHNVINCTGVVITTNRKDSLYLPADDRRHYVAWCILEKEHFDEKYWTNIWAWYHGGGFSHVAAYLMAYDISAFDPKASPPKTEAFWAIVETNRVRESSEFADAIEALGEVDPNSSAHVLPKAITLTQISDAAERRHNYDFVKFLEDRRNSRVIPHRMSESGYTPVRHLTRKDGLWQIGEKRYVIYAKEELSAHDRYEAAKALVAAAEADMVRVEAEIAAAPNDVARSKIKPSIWGKPRRRGQ